MSGQDGCLVIFKIRRRGKSIEFILHLLAASDVTVTKKQLCCRQYFKITDITVWPHCNLLCVEVWYIYLAVQQMSEYHVWSKLKTTLAKHSHSLIGMKFNQTLCTSVSKSLIISHPWLTFCRPQWSSQVVRLPLQKDSQHSTSWGTHSTDNQRMSFGTYLCSKSALPPCSSGSRKADSRGCINGLLSLAAIREALARGEGSWGVSIPPGPSQQGRLEWLCPSTKGGESLHFRLAPGSCTFPYGLHTRYPPPLIINLFVNKLSSIYWVEWAIIS